MSESRTHYIHYDADGNKVPTPVYNTVQVGIPESAGIRETMVALRRAISIDDVREVEDTDMYFSRALDAVLDVHGEVSVTASGMMCDPTITIKCTNDGQEWPCATIAALCAALRVPNTNPERR